MYNLIKKYTLSHALIIAKEKKASLSNTYRRLSYSQEGEDLILTRLFGKKNNGFYIDVGAHHPLRFSNTYIFYKRGWSGINIEPNPDALALFNRYRKRDINLSLGANKSDGVLYYFMFNEPALNSFNEALSKERDGMAHYRIVNKKTIKVQRLSKILEENLPDGIKIDFLSIDVEGFDLNVLESNDWVRFRPNCVLVEDKDFNLALANSNPINRFMNKNNYDLFAKTYNTLIYINKDLKIN